MTRLFTIILLLHLTLPVFCTNDAIFCTKDLLVPSSSDSFDKKTPLAKKQKLEENFMHEQEESSEEENSEEESSEEDSFLHEFNYNQGVSDNNDDFEHYLLTEEYEKAAKALLEEIWAGDYEMLNWVCHNLNFNLFSLYDNKEREKLIALVPKIEKKLQKQPKQTISLKKQ